MWDPLPSQPSSFPHRCMQCWLLPALKQIIFNRTEAVGIFKADWLCVTVLNKQSYWGRSSVIAWLFVFWGFLFKKMLPYKTWAAIKIKMKEAKGCETIQNPD